MAESNNNIKKLTIVVGAGDEYVCDTDNASHHYLLIDARAVAVNSLRKTYAEQEQVSVQQAVVTASAGRTQFYHYSLPEFSSTLKPDALKQFLPGLTIKGSEFVSGASIVDILEEAPTSQSLELVFNVPGQELSLLIPLAGSAHFNRIDSLVITSANSPLYENGNTAAELADWLSDQGFTSQPKTDQAFSLITQGWTIDKQARQIAQLTKERDDALARASALETKLDESVARASGTSEQLEHLKATLQSTEKALVQANEENQKYIDWTHNLEAELEQANTVQEQLIKERDAVDEAKKEYVDWAQTLKSENEILEQKLDAAERYNEQLSNLNKHMDYMFEQQRLHLEQATNALGAHVSNTSQNQLDSVKAQFYLKDLLVDKASALLGSQSNLSDSTAMQLAEYLTEYNYDLVIEFGSGKSTELLALLMCRIKQGSSTKRVSSDKLDSGYIEGSSLPKRIVSFEHEKVKYEEVQAVIERDGLGDLVDLKFSPLVAKSIYAKDHLFYDCENTLHNVSISLSDRLSSILVRGPIQHRGNQDFGKMMFLSVLDFFSSHQLDFVIEGEVSQDVLDDFNLVLEERALRHKINWKKASTLIRVNS